MLTIICCFTSSDIELFIPMCCVSVSKRLPLRWNIWGWMKDSWSWKTHDVSLVLICIYMCTEEVRGTNIIYIHKCKQICMNACSGALVILVNLILHSHLIWIEHPLISYACMKIFFSIIFTLKIHLNIIIINASIDI